MSRILDHDTHRRPRGYRCQPTQPSHLQRDARITNPRRKKAHWSEKVAAEWGWTPQKVQALCLAAAFFITMIWMLG